MNLKGPLAGIPVSLKDSIQVKGFDISVGYSRNTGKPAVEDGAMVRLLKEISVFKSTDSPSLLKIRRAGWEYYYSHH